MTFMLSDDRKEVVGIVDKGEAINYRDVEDIMLRVLKSFPGDMENLSQIYRHTPLYNFLKNKITHKALSHV